MSNAYYSAQIHIVDNPYSNNVYIEPPEGKTLYVHGIATGNAPTAAAGTEGSVQINNGSDEFTFDSTFNFIKETDELQAPNFKTDLIYNQAESDTLGFNSIYDGPGVFPQSVYSRLTDTSHNFGTDICISENGTLTSACPNYVLGNSTGGVSVWDEDPTGFNEYSSALTFSNFTLEATVNQTCISEEGTYQFFTDGNQQFYIYAYKLVAGVWTEVDNTTGVRLCKCSRLDSDTIKLLCCDESKRFFVLTFDCLTDSFGSSETLIGPGSYEYDLIYPMSISNVWLSFMFEDTVYYYKYNGTTWDLAFSAAVLLGQDIKVKVNTIDTSSILNCVAVNGGLYIRNSNTLLASFVGNYKCVCISPSLSFIFAYEETLQAIQVFYLDGTWHKQTNSYAITNITCMFCSNDWLAVGRPISNQGTIFKIQSYTNGYVDISNIVMNDESNKLEINSIFGTVFNNSIVTIPNVNSTLINSTQLVLENGTFTDPSMYLGTHKIYSDTTDLSFDDKLIVNSEANFLVPVVISDGSVGSPGIKFDDACGIYQQSAGHVSVSTGGTNRLDISTMTSSSNKIAILPTGDTTNPALILESDGNGFYKSGSTIGITTAGTMRLTTDNDATISQRPFKHLNNGSVAAPSFSWTNASNTGMYWTNESSKDYINFTVAGTKTARISSDNKIYSDALFGLNNQTATLEMGTYSVDLGLNGVYKFRTADSGAYKTVFSLDNTGLCGLGSDSSAGSVLKVRTAGSGSWGIEQLMVSTGSPGTEYQIFLYGANTGSSSQVGSITTNGTTTSYNTTSDYRLKQNIKPLVNQLERIDLLEPVSFKWKNNGQDSEGFLAHELQEVFPEAVHGKKDEINEDGSMKLQSIDMSFLISSLVSCIQELKEEIRKIKEELKTFV